MNYNNSLWHKIIFYLMGVKRHPDFDYYITRCNSTYILEWDNKDLLREGWVKCSDIEMCFGVVTLIYKRLKGFEPYSFVLSEWSFEDLHGKIVSYKILGAKCENGICYEKIKNPHWEIIYGK